MKKHHKAIVLSDLHLGTAGSKAREVVQFLKYNSCEILILNGDIIDGWQLKKYGKWKKHHTKFFKRVLKMVGKDNTRIIYLRGNHDDFLDQVLPITIGSISIVRDYIYESHNKRYYIIHGDVFDSITTNLKWIAKLGDAGYTFLLFVNRIYNGYRISKGLPYYSLSQKIKAKVKKAVSYVSDFETQLAALARIKKCEGIICGHIHQPAIKVFDDGTIYMNSGDWVETMSALTEDFEGNWKVVHFSDNEALYKELDETEEKEEAEESIRATLIFQQDLSELKEIVKVRKKEI